MVKEPLAGKVKSRLGRDIGMTGAAWWYRHQVNRLLRRLNDPRWQLILAVSPDKLVRGNRVWPAYLARVPQGQGDLGQRMARLLRDLGPGPVCLIGSDIPGVERKHIWQGFQALGGHSVVFGPAPDGGYWLVGAKGRAARATGFLRGVRWSSPHALEDSIASSNEKPAFVDTLRDVDTATDLAALKDSA